MTILNKEPPMQRMKFCLTIKYDIDYRDSVESIVKAHKDVFEEGPIDFLQYILNNENTRLEYEFVPSDDNEEDPAEGDEIFNCRFYFYNNRSADSNICLKFGVLCSAMLCKHMDKHKGNALYLPVN